MTAAALYFIMLVVAPLSTLAPLTLARERCIAIRFANKISLPMHNTQFLLFIGE